jgi:BirA family biotin operon repressor/biotin-[acetyl-CoA-carboxylase] ligase
MFAFAELKTFVKQLEKTIYCVIILYMSNLCKFNTDTLKHNILHYDSVSSTNLIANDMIATLPHGSIILADTQTNGSGRFGRVFCSPYGGIYMSIVIKNWTQQSSTLTAHAALCLCNTLQALVDVDVSIKWVNDIIIQNKKVCGISCQSKVDSKSSQTWFIVGIGLNVYTDINQFDISLQNKVTSLKYYSSNTIDKAKLIKDIADSILTKPLDKEHVFEQYAAKIPFLGQPILVFFNDTQYLATAQGIDKNGHLIVKTPDGLLTLNNQEISIRTQI